jgi:hypothetical protein
MSHDLTKAVARLKLAIQVVEGEVERLETLAPSLRDDRLRDARTMAEKLRSQAAAIRGQVRALEAQLSAAPLAQPRRYAAMACP